MNLSLKGFLAAGVCAGIKEEGKLDLGLIYSEKEASVGAVFTRNKVKAAPITVSQAHLTMNRRKAKAIIVNSGNANACTGNKGIEDALRTTQLVADQLGIARQQVLVASTGVIGKRLDMNSISKAIPKVVKDLSPTGLDRFAKAIMTTDTFPKISVFEGDGYKIVGIAKGAGMIMPDMATMLSFILTDMQADPEWLQSTLLRTVEKTFNRITVDGQTSTNDTVIIMANGTSNITEADTFREGLFKVCSELSKMIVKDGEGATKIVDIIVKGAKSPSDAITGARSVANSSLVKTAIYGEDPNWGRIMAALGSSGIEIEPEYVDIWIEDVQIVSAGQGTGEEKEKMASERMKKNEFSILIDLKKGPYQDHILTCDLTHKYVSINAEYRT
jgi:glutamate N-acetyltransferase/amino-acid N-acetyltransferase